MFLKVNESQFVFLLSPKYSGKNFEKSRSSNFSVFLIVRILTSILKKKILIDKNFS